MQRWAGVCACVGRFRWLKVKPTPRHFFHLGVSPVLTSKTAFLRWNNFLTDNWLRIHYYSICIIASLHPAWTNRWLTKLGHAVWSYVEANCRAIFTHINITMILVKVESCAHAICHIFMFVGNKFVMRQCGWQCLGSWSCDQQDWLLLRNYI